MKKLILLIVIMGLGLLASGATYIPYYINGESIDSVLIIRYNVSSPAWDTTKITTSLGWDSLSVDTTKNYKTFYQFYYEDDTIPSMVCAETWFFSKYSSEGAGTYTHYVKVMDSSATTDSTLEGIKVKYYNSAGSYRGEGTSGSNGVFSIGVDSGSYVFKVYNAQYAQTDSMVDTVTTNSDTTIIYLYDNSAANHCTVYGYITNPEGDSLNLAYVKFEPPSLNNSADSSIVLKGKSICAWTNSNGYFSQSLLYSSKYNDQEYKVTVGHHDYTDQITSIVVPDSTTYKLHFGLE